MKILVMKIQCDIRFENHDVQVQEKAFKSLGCIIRCYNYLISTDRLANYTTYIRTKNGKELLYVGRGLKQIYIGAFEPYAKEVVSSQ